MKSSPLISAVLSGLVGSYFATIVAAVDVQKQTVEKFRFTPVKLHFGQKNMDRFDSTVLVPLVELYVTDVTEYLQSGKSTTYRNPILLRGKVALDEESTGIAESGFNFFGGETDATGEMYFDGGPYKATSIRCVFLNDANAKSGIGKGVKIDQAGDQSFGPEERQTVPDDAEAVECLASYVRNTRVGWASGQWLPVE